MIDFLKNIKTNYKILRNSVMRFLNVRDLIEENQYTLQELKLKYDELEKKYKEFKNKHKRYISDNQSQKEKEKKEFELVSKTLVEKEKILRKTLNDLERLEAENFRLALLKTAYCLNSVSSTFDIAQLEKIPEKNKDRNKERHKINELRSLQLKQLIYENNELHSALIQSQNKIDEQKIRLNQIQRVLINQIDFESIKIVKIDNLCSIPFVEFNVQNLFFKDQNINDFKFTIALKDGFVGIKVINNSDQDFLFPKLIEKSREQANLFLKLASSHYKNIILATKLLENLIDQKWRCLNSDIDFDINFWGPLVNTLVLKFKQLPSLIRYDDVRLKSEMVNPDYEHLWLEFLGLSYGEKFWSKFEIRIGAASIEKTNFSMHPKIEIPLIESIEKPFESWFVESKDPFGDKFELRFSLEKNVIDLAVLSKLNNFDKEFLFKLIKILPIALTKLSTQNISLYRPWDVWINFSNQTGILLDSILKNIQLTSNNSIEMQKPKSYIENEVRLINVKNKIPDKNSHGK